MKSKKYRHVAAILVRVKSGFCKHKESEEDSEMNIALPIDGTFSLHTAHRLWGFKMSSN